MNELQVYKSKTNAILTLIFPLFILMLIIFYFIITPITAHAEENTENIYYFTSYTKNYKSDGTLYSSEFSRYEYKTTSRIAAYQQIKSETSIKLNFINGVNSKAYLKCVESSNSNNIGKTIFGEYKISESHYSDTNIITDVYITSDTNIPIFSTIDEAINYIETGDDSGQINKPIDMSTATYNSDIPVPKLVFNSQGGYKFNIDNAVDGYYIQIKGRWYTVDDITLYKENLMWKYKYDTLLKGSLTDWVEPNEKILATAEHDLCNYNCNGYGGDAFKALLTKYPIDNRTYSGGKNALGDKISGYTDALSSLKDLHLKNPESAFNSPEIYIRFIVVNDNNSVQYGKWCHWYSNLANSTGSSGFNLDDSDNVSGESQSYNGLTDEELNNNEQQENPRNDSDIYTYVNSDYIKHNIEISSDISNKTGAFFELLNSMFSAMGQFPQMFKDVFMFLPPWFINFIIISMGAIIIARFIGR